jgi:hypothetical protein
MATKYNKILSGYQLHQVVKRRKNQHFENHLCPRPQGTDDEDRDGSRNIGFLAF